MKQGTRVAKREGVGPEPAAPAAVTLAEAGTRAEATGENRAEALKAIREMLSEVAEDALRLGILDCIPLIAAADLAIDDALAKHR